MVTAIDFVERLSLERDISIKRQCVETRGIEEIILTIISSSALIIVANALRDLAQKKKIHIQITTENGNQVDIQSEGNDISEASEIMGYLSNNMHKDINENVSKNIQEQALEIKMQLEKD
jgi:hypothetical protein